MEVVKKDQSRNLKTGKVYSRVIYHCKKDDLWVNLEIPKK